MATIETMFKLQTSLCITLIVSIIGSLLCIALLFGIILFERNQHYRTLINQLVTSMYWYGILWLVTLQFPTIVKLKSELEKLNGNGTKDLEPIQMEENSQMM